MGRIPMDETLVQAENPLAIMTSTQKTPWAEFLWAKRLHKKKIPDSYDVNTEGSMGRIPIGETLVQEEKPLAIMTSTRKTLWAEFLWANAQMKKNPGSTDINTEYSMGRIPMGETLTWRKTTAALTSTRKTLWAEFLWAKCLYKKKNPDSYDVNTEDTMGRIPMGETLAQEENPRLSWHQHRRLHGQNSYGRNACTRRNSLTLMTLTQKALWAEFLWAKRLYKKKNPWLSWHQHRRLNGQNSYGRTLTWRKTTALLT